MNLRIQNSEFGMTVRRRLSLLTYRFLRYKEGGVMTWRSAGGRIRFRGVTACLLAAVTMAVPAVARAADLLLDHVEYLRAGGAAQQTSLSFPGCDTQGTYVLTIANGQDDAHRASTGTVSVNGVAIVAAVDFTSSPATITKTISEVAQRNTLALSVTGPQGSVIGWKVTGEVTCPDITIESPPPGSVIDRAEVTVKGKVRHRTPEVGVTVNGELAQVNGNDWVASVPLNAGGNTLSVVMIDESHLTVTTSQIVSRADAIPRGITVGVSNANGIAPLDVSFLITNETGKAISQYTLDFGDGTSTTVAAGVEVSHRYESEGVFRAVATGTETNGTLHMDSAPVSVHALPPLKTRWEKMKAGLALGDIAGALASFTETEARVQEQIFQSMGSQAQTMVQAMQDIERVYLEGDRAQYRIKRNELVGGVEKPITYYIEFVRDESGFWRIDSF